MTDTALTLDLSDPGVPELLRETDALKIFEHIRTAGRLVTVHEIGLSLGKGKIEVHRHVDLLVKHRLLRVVRARKPRTEVGYRATCDRLIISFDENDPDVIETILAMSKTHVADFESEVDRYSDSEFHSEAGFRFKQMSTHHFSKSELAELRRRILSVVSFLTMPRTPTRRTRASGNGEVGEPIYCNQAISISLEPIAGELLPLPTIISTPRSKIWQWDDSQANSGGLSSLSPREREVALALSDGLSRAQVADQFGLSVHTVGTLVRRAYKKPGVSSQVELAARLAGHNRPVPGDPE